MFLCIVMGKSVKKSNSPRYLDGFVLLEGFSSEYKRGESVLQVLETPRYYVWMTSYRLEFVSDLECKHSRVPSGMHPNDSLSGLPFPSPF
jgi:hypothetical protein